MEKRTPIADSRILVTGGTGSWGTELVKQLLEKYPSVKEIRIYSRGEHKQVDMKRAFNNNPKLKFIIGDIRDKTILSYAMRDVDIVFHLAALKHVPVCEENTWEAVLTNVNGTQNVIEAAIFNKVKKVIDVSTDKAVEPFNLYGMTKACGEKLVVNANFNYAQDEGMPEFICIRGGNVIGTNGSVIPLFKSQLLNGNTITVTDPDMTRYLMSTREAIGLIFTAVEHSSGGELFVMKMPAATVGTIANVMIRMFGNKDSVVKKIGMRPGEKYHEVLVSKNEAPFTRVFSDKHFVILPQIGGDLLERNYRDLPHIGMNEFTSENTHRLSEDELEALLRKESWLLQGAEPRPLQTTIHIPATTNEKVGITGANGFIGKALRKQLDEEHVPYAAFEGDLLDRKNVESFFQNNAVSTLVHLAGEFYPPFGQLTERNVLTTRNLLDAGKRFGLKKIVYASSGAVYGEPEGAESRETDALKPSTLYGLSKMFAEDVIRYYHDRDGIGYVILRFPNVYGPGATKGVIYNLMNDIKSKGRVTLNGDGKQSRNFLHVDDACRAIVLAIRYDGSDTFNISNPVRLSLNDVIQLFRRTHQFEIDHKPADNDLKDLVLNIDKAKKVLGFQPKHAHLEV